MKKLKKTIAICLTVMLLLLSSGSVLAGTSQTAQENPYNIITSEEIDGRMRISFSEKFKSEFDETDFPGMTITYTEDGVPIVYDPNERTERQGVFAVGRYSKNGFYTDSACTNLLFYVLKDAEVEVIDSAATTTVAKVKYANSTGYMKKAELKF